MVSDDSSGFSIRRAGGDVLLVAFGGIRQGMGMPGFEFRRLLDGLACDQVFVRDVEQAWYQRGARPEARSIRQLADALDRIRRERSYRRTVFVGNSMGGFGAMVLGGILDVDHVLAFSPQTFVQLPLRLIHGDRRWRDQVRRLHLRPRSHPRYRNVAWALRHHAPRNLTIEVHVSSQDSLDLAHARYLAKRWPIELRVHREGGHGLVRVLRGDGQLEFILHRAVERD